MVAVPKSVYCFGSPTTATLGWRCAPPCVVGGGGGHQPYILLELDTKAAALSSLLRWLLLLLLLHWASSLHPAHYSRHNAQHRPLGNLQDMTRRTEGMRWSNYTEWALWNFNCPSKCSHTTLEWTVIIITRALYPPDHFIHCCTLL